MPGYAKPTNRKSNPNERQIERKTALSPSKLYKDAEEYLNLQAEVSRLTKQLNKLKAELKSVAMDHAVEQEDTGHLILDVSKGRRDPMYIVLEARETVSVIPTSLEVVKNFPPDIRKGLIQNVEIVDVDEVKRRVENSRIPLRLAKKIMSTETNYALKVKR